MTKIDLEKIPVVDLELKEGELLTDLIDIADSDDEFFDNEPAEIEVIINPVYKK